MEFLKKHKSLVLACTIIGVIVLIGIGLLLGRHVDNKIDPRKTDYGSAGEVTVVDPVDSDENDENVATVVKKTPDFTTFKIGGKAYTLGSSTYNYLYINGWILDEYSQSFYKDFLTMTNADDGTFLYARLQSAKGSQSQEADFNRKLCGIYQTSDESVCRDINVCGVTIGSSLDDVLKKLGDPKTTSEDNEIHQTTLEYSYKNATMSIVVATQDSSSDVNAVHIGSGSANAMPQQETGVVSIMISLPEDSTPTVDIN